MRTLLHSLGLSLLMISLLMPWVAGSGSRRIEIYDAPLDPHVWYAIDALPMLFGLLRVSIRPFDNALYPSLALDVAVIGLFVLGALAAGLRLRWLRGRTDWAGITRVTAALFLFGSWLAAACICALRRYEFGS